ncbi:MAG: energy-coupling factor transporter ATPase [Acutalibacteraceae bacterium]
MNIIRTENLSFTYGVNTPYEKKAVKNLNINIKKGEFLGIIGHTGSGKSTLVQMLNGLIKPSEGKIFLNDKDIWENPKEIRNVRFKVGMVFQYPEYQLFEETVEKDIAFGPINKGVTGALINRIVNNSAEFVGLKESLLKKSPFDLSGGEKRRAAIAGVIAMEPEVLILDEPTAGLDPKGRDKLLYQIKNYHKKTGNTVVLVSHSMEDIASVADRILVMNKGNAEMLDSTKQVFSHEKELNSMGLRVPEITSVMTSLENLGYDVPKGILTLDEAEEAIVSLLKKEGKIC